MGYICLRGLASVYEHTVKHLGRVGFLRAVLTTSQRLPSGSSTRLKYWLILGLSQTKDSPN